MRRGSLFNLAKFMVSILQNELHGNVKMLRHEAMQIGGFTVIDLEKFVSLRAR